MMEGMRAPLVIPVLLLLGCAKPGPELTVVRPQGEGWSLSLHAGTPGHWELVLWHPEAFQIRGDDPVRSFLLGEKIKPSVSSETTQSFKEPARTVTTTRWVLDEARWRTGEPFQIRVKHGFPNMEPFSTFREVLLEVRLGPQPGSPEGLMVRVLEP